MHSRFSNLTLAQAALLVLGLPQLVGAQSLTCTLSDTAYTIQPQLNQNNLHVADSPIEFKAEAADVSKDGWSSLSGKVEVRQGSRAISTERLRFNPSTGEMVANGQFSLEDSTLFLSGNAANLSRSGDAQVEHAGFLLKKNAGRGTSESIRLASNGNLSLEDVTYTTCPSAEPGWELKLSDLAIDQKSQIGTGRNVQLQFEGVPIFYTPWISFPVGNQRKSGFLFPSIGGSTRSGEAISVPWYWNIAANYDDTITPSIITNRGFRLDNEFRYLGESSRTQLTTSYLPNDKSKDRWRGNASIRYVNDFNDVLRLDVKANSVSDHFWFEDFGTNSANTSQVYLPSSLTLSTQSSHWRGKFQFMTMQTLDDEIALTNRPYTQSPQLIINGRENLPWGLKFTLDSELNYFTHLSADTSPLTDNISSTRLHLNPSLNLPLTKPGLFLVPSIGWYYTGYDLKNPTNSTPTHPSLSGSIYSVDAGLILERPINKQKYVQTLEPRLLYAYVPYRDQASLPAPFDTGIPDLSLNQFFRPNRFIGPDRLGDTNQLSVGFTSRLLDQADGNQLFSGTLGQTFNFTKPCITSLTTISCDAITAFTNSSDLLGELAVNAYRNISINFATQWKPETNRAQRSNFFAQYRSDNSHIFNIAYRYDQGKVEQWETSGAWPINNRWSGFSRIVYSRPDATLLDHFLGFEYRSCCFNIRGVAGRAITSRNGEYETQFKLQLELKGLSSIGTADAFLTGGIAGYSAHESSL